MANAWGATLPDEILENIAGKIAMHECDVAAARLVCKRWSVAVPSAVKALDVEGEIPDGPLARNMSSLESVTWTYGIYSPSFAPPRSLKVLELRYAVPSGSLKHLALGFPYIESLVLDRVPLTCRGGYDLSPLASLASLKSLSLLTGDLSEDNPVKAILGLEKLTSLTSLRLKDDNMKALPQAVFQLTRLESLDLRGCVEFRAPTGLERLPRLTHIDTNGCYKLFWPVY
jgi:hypothetical protein